MIKIKLLTIIIILGLTSCSSGRLKIDDLTIDDVEDSDCMSEYHVPGEHELEKIARITKQGVGTSASYLLSGMGYAGEVILYTAGTLVVGIAICSPIIVIEGASKSNGNISSECIGKVSGEVGISVDSKQSLGNEIFRETEPWRCDDVDHITKGLRKVTECMAKKGNIEGAKSQLQALLKDNTVRKCVSRPERKIIKDLIANYKKVELI